AGKSVVAKFDGGRLSSDGGILVLREIEQRLRVADRLAACIEDPRSPDQITHSLADIIHFRLPMIAAEDGNDASNLRADSCSRWRCGDLRANALDLRDALSYLAAIGDGAEFKNGRQLAASIGSKAISNPLTPTMFFLGFLLFHPAFF